MMYHSLSGMGTCTDGFDEYGMACTDFSTITSDPAATAAAINYLNTPVQPLTSLPTSGNASTGFNWGSVFAPLANAASNIFSTRYAVPQLNAGQTIQTGPGGTLMTQNPSNMPATGGYLPAAVGGLDLTTMLLLGGGVLVLVMVMKGHK